jgi:hypothetical protein
VNEVVAHSEAGDEVVVHSEGGDMAKKCSGAGVEGGRWRRHGGAHITRISL